jgi:hypothetical protein
VWLHVTPTLHQTLPLFSSLGTTGTYIWASEINIAQHTARITVESQVRNDGTTPQQIRLEAMLVDLSGKSVAHFTSEKIETIAPDETRTLTATTSASDLHFWSWGYGYLYKVVTTLIVDRKPGDSVVTRTGFRETAFHDGMIYLNGRVLQVHGYAQRTTNEWPAIGLSVPPWMSDLSNKLMVQSNGNLVRWMHVTPWKQDVESADRVGLLESLPAGDAEGDSKGRQWEQRVELMRDAIIYNRNDPSILFYESGNKGISETHMQDMLHVRDQYDPHGGRAIGAREMLASHSAEYGGEMLYVNKSATKPLWAHEYNRDEGARKFQDDDTPPFHLDSPLYNRNQDSFTLEDVRRWDDYFEARPGTGTRVSSGGVNIIWSDSNTHFRGDNNYRRSGEVDAMRLPKDAFFAHQAMWDGWVDPEHPRLHIVGHWNFAPGVKRSVYVVSNAEKVELRLNAESLGFGVRSSHFLFTFDNVTYVPGKLDAIAYDAHDQVVATATVKTAGQPVALKLTPHTAPHGMRADGNDMALVDVEVIDADGARCPTALNLIHFSLTGPAEWRGGIAQGSAAPAPAGTAVNDNPQLANQGLAATLPTPLLHEDNYILSRDLPVEAGINRVILRSVPASGKITLVAKADGLKSARLQLASRPILARNGLSNYSPDADQPVNLERGPTPSTPSYSASRVPIAIASSTAGANSDAAAKSYDDDETTSWSSAVNSAGDKITDGLPPRSGTAGDEAPSVSASLDTAWIEHSFARPERITQLDLKLNGFRMRRYPLRITLDGETVFEGLTPPSLGYCNLRLTPTTGQHLRITLVGPPVEVTEFHTVVELNGKVDQSSQPGKPILSIIEVEIYGEPLNPADPPRLQ